jgi:hypothetical protein
VTTAIGASEWWCAGFLRRRVPGRSRSPWPQPLALAAAARPGRSRSPWPQPLALAAAARLRRSRKCHFLREQESPIRVSDIVEAESKAKTKKCLHPANSECRGPIVRAHTVQRALLEQIAHDGHVYGLKRNFAAIKNAGGKLVPSKLGLANASTFTGFCGAHDKAVFAPIEDGPIKPCPEHAFLLVYRTVCHELYAKQFASTMIPAIMQTDRNRTPTQQLALQRFLGQYASGVGIGLRDMLYHKEKYDRVLRTRISLEFERYL